MIRNTTDPIPELNEFNLPGEYDAAAITDISLNPPDNSKIDSAYFLADLQICTTYTPSLLDFLIPPKEIFDRLCISYDKTYLFLISIVRCLIYMLLTSLYYDVADIENDFAYVIFVVLVIWCIMNIVFILIIIFKQTKFTTYSLLPTIGVNVPATGPSGSVPSGIQLADDIYPQ